MLAIRMQRIGRKGYPEYRVVVQDARLSPTSGRVVAKVGHYNPHTKVTTIDKDKVTYYLSNGAQPSERVVRILSAEKVELPDWVEQPANKKKRSIRNPEKLRRNQEPEVSEESAPEADTATDETADSEPKAAVEEAPEQAGKTVS